MLWIFRPRHIMWKYWMFQPEKPLRTGYVWELIFFIIILLRLEKIAENESIFAYVVWIMTTTKQFLTKNPPIFFCLTLSCSHKTITGWKQWIKILQQQKISGKGSRKKSIEKKTRQFFLCWPVCMTRIIVIYFLQYEYLIGYLWGFILLTPRLLGPRVNECLQ